MSHADQLDDRERLAELNTSADALLKKLRAAADLLDEVSAKWQALRFTVDDLRELSYCAQPIAAHLHAALESWNDLPRIDEVQNYAAAVADTAPS